MAPFDGHGELPDNISPLITRDKQAQLLDDGSPLRSLSMQPQRHVGTTTAVPNHSTNCANEVVHRDAIGEPSHSNRDGFTALKSPISNDKHITNLPERQPATLMLDEGSPLGSTSTSAEQTHCRMAPLPSLFRICAGRVIEEDDPRESPRVDIRWRMIHARSKFL